MTLGRAARAFVFVVSALLGVACGGSSGSSPRAASSKSTEVDLAQPTTNDANAAPGETRTVWSRPASGGATSSEVPVDASDAIWGAGDAPVTLVVFTDFQCPFCSRAHPTVSQLMRQYGPQKLRVVFKHNPLPFHQDALPAALAAQAVYELAGPSAFFAYVDRVFRGQSQLTDENLLAWAAEVGVEPSSLLKAAGSPAVRGKVENDMALAARLGLRGTPSFLVNGSRLIGAQPYEEFKERVEEELRGARALRDQGVAPGEVFAKRVAENIAKPEPGEEPPARAAPPPDATVWKVPVGKSPSLGPANALVTLVEFSDYQCPYCKRAHATVEELLKRYPGKLRVVFKHRPLPFHPRAMPAALFAMEARAQRGDKGFFEASKLLFDSAPALEDDDLVALGKKMKLNEARVKAALAKGTHKPAIEADGDLADDVEAKGTPTFYVNGKKLSGAKPIAEFQTLIDAELAVAESKVKAGTPALSVYAELIRDGRAGEPLELAATTPSFGKDNPSKGAAKAAVTIQVFSDFECPFCSRFLPTLAQIEKQYAGRVRIVWRNLPLPFHPNARTAAMAAMEAHAQKGDSGFWRMHDLLFANQRSLDRSSIEGHAKKLGMNLDKLRAALDQQKHETVIKADEAAANAAGVDGTPAIVVNGYHLAGAQPVAKLKRVIDRALEDAKLGRKPQP